MGRGEDEVRAALERAEVLDDLGRNDEVLALLSPMLASHPDHAELVRQTAQALLHQGGRQNYKEGIRLARRAVALDPEDAWAVAVLGHGLTLTISKWGEAKELMARACAMAPNDPYVHLVRAHGLESISFVRYGEAHEAVLRVVELAPNDPEPLLLKAKIEYGRLNPLDDDEREKVLTSIREVLRLDPGNADAAFLLAQAKAPGTPAEEAAAFHEAVRRDPRHTEAIQRVDSNLVKPLRGGYWMLWFLALLQSFFLWRDIDLGWLVKVLLFLFVLLIPWLRFLRARRDSPVGFGKHDGFDPLLVGFGVLSYLAAAACHASTTLLGTAAIRTCFVLLVLAGAVYLWRARRRRKRFGG